jgi:hypothetical protein
LRQQIGAFLNLNEKESLNFEGQMRTRVDAVFDSSTPQPPPLRLCPKFGSDRISAGAFAMFYFHWSGSATNLDPDGIDLSDLAAARAEAVATIADIYCVTATWIFSGLANL